MTECAQCGNCCETIWFNGTKGQLAQRLKDPNETEANKADAVFVIEHWHRSSGGGFNTFFSCDQFNAETRMCEAHDNRPPICSGYPWYGKEPALPPSPTKLDRRCSFWHDVPRDQWPDWADPLPTPVSIVRK